MKRTGTIETIEQKTGNNGPYWRVKIDNKWYTAFDEVHALVGDQVSFDAISKEVGDKTFWNVKNLLVTAEDAGMTRDKGTPEKTPATGRSVAHTPDMSHFRCVAFCGLCELVGTDMEMKPAAKLGMVMECLDDWAQKLASGQFPVGTVAGQDEDDSDLPF